MWFGHRRRVVSPKCRAVYVMVVLVFMGGGIFDPSKLLGVILIGLGVFLTQRQPGEEKNHAVLKFLYGIFPNQ